MDIARYTDKLKALLPSSVALPAMPDNLSLPPIVKEKWDLVDKLHLLIVLGGVLGFYLLIFVYVHFSADRTIAKIEQRMATISVELTKAEHVASPHTNVRPTNAHNYGTNTNKSDTYSQAMASANLIKGLSSYNESVGRLPVIRSSDNLTSFRAYQTPFSLNGIGKQQVMSFIIKDYGLSDKDSNMALDILPPEISFLLSPYAALPQEWINRARARGHEVWMEIPIQHGQHNDTGLNTIYHHTSLSEKGHLLHKSLARGLGYVGVGLFMDQTAFDSDTHYRELVSELYGRGLAVFAINPKAPSFVETMAITKAAPYMKATGDLVYVPGKECFAPIEEIAHSLGQAVTVVPSYPVLIKKLALWLEKVGKIDYVIAPVSAIYDVPLARSGNMPSETQHTKSRIQHQQKQENHTMLQGLSDNDRIEPQEDAIHHGH